jgi:hypothetical protein
MRKVVTAFLAMLLLASGSAVDAKKKPKPAPAPIPLDRPSTATPTPLSKSERRGLNDVLGKGVEELKRMFGEPRIDVVEVYGRKLQFAGKPCILDAYLYPDGKDGAEIVTHIDARRSDGAEVDRAACVNALMRR